MNKKQEAELIKLLIDFLIDAEHLYNVEKYSLKAYLNDRSTKVPITFRKQDQWLDNITIDYYQQEILEECGGFNTEDNYVVLGCELKEFHGAGEIRYYFNEELTNKLNLEFAKK